MPDIRGKEFKPERSAFSLMLVSKAAIKKKGRVWRVSVGKVPAEFRSPAPGWCQAGCMECQTSGGRDRRPLEQAGASYCDSIHTGGVIKKGTQNQSQASTCTHTCPYTCAHLHVNTCTCIHTIHIKSVDKNAEELWNCFALFGMNDSAYMENREAKD